MSIEITDEEIKKKLLVEINSKMWDWRIEPLFAELFNKDENFRKDCLEIMKQKLKDVNLESLVKKMFKEAITEKFNEDWD